MAHLDAHPIVIAAVVGHWSEGALVRNLTLTLTNPNPNPTTI